MSWLCVINIPVPEIQYSEPHTPYDHIRSLILPLSEYRVLIVCITTSLAKVCYHSNIVLLQRDRWRIMCHYFWQQDRQYKGSSFCSKVSIKVVRWPQGQLTAPYKSELSSKVLDILKDITYFLSILMLKHKHMFYLFVFGRCSKILVSIFVQSVNSQMVSNFWHCIVSLYGVSMNMFTWCGLLTMHFPIYNRSSGLYPHLRSRWVRAGGTSWAHQPQSITQWQEPLEHGGASVEPQVRMYETGWVPLYFI